MKIFLLTLLISVSTLSWAQSKTYTQTEVDTKLELQQEKLNSKLKEIESEKSTLHTSIQAQDKRIDDIKDNVEKEHICLDRFIVILSIIIAVLGLAMIVTGWWLNKRTEKSEAKIEKELEAIQQLRKEVEIHKKEAEKDAVCIAASKEEIDVSKQKIETMTSSFQNKLIEIDFLLVQAKVKVLSSSGATGDKTTNTNDVKRVSELTRKTKKKEEYTALDWAVEALEEQNKGNYQQACTLYKKAIIADPENKMENHHIIYNNWGNALYELAKQEKGIKIFEESFEKYKIATELNPNYSSAYNNWGIALYELAKQEKDEKLFEESFEKYEKSTELNPNYSSAYNNWGIALFDLAKQEKNEKLFEESFEKYKKATELNPNDSTAYNNWGTALSELAKQEKDEKLFEESFEKYKKATELNPNHYSAYNNWGSALLYLVQLEKNISKYKNDIQNILLKAEKLKEGSGSYNLACLHSLLNEKDTAFKYFENALRLNTTPDREHIEDDTDLDNIKSDPRFNELLDKYLPKDSN